MRDVLFCYGTDAGRESLSRSSKYGCFKAAFADILTAGSYINVFYKYKYELENVCFVNKYV